MASIAATATGFRTSVTMPSTLAAPCRCKTFASPIAVASSHHRDRSVSMITRGPAGPDTLTAGVLVEGVSRAVDPEEPEEHPADVIATRRVATASERITCRRSTAEFTYTAPRSAMTYFAGTTN